MHVYLYIYIYIYTYMHGKPGGWQQSPTCSCPETNDEQIFRNPVTTRFCYKILVDVSVPPIYKTPVAAVAFRHGKKLRI